MEAASLDEVARGRVIVGVGRVLNALRKQGTERHRTPRRRRGWRRPAKRDIGDMRRKRK